MPEESHEQEVVESGEVDGLKGYLSQKSAGRYLDLSYGTVHRWILSGALPYYELPSGGGNHKPIIRVSLKDLDNFVAETRVEAS